MAFAVGIDLGTTNTVVAAVREGVAATLADTHGEKLLPSVLSIEPGGTVVVGREALEQRVSNAQNTVYSVKRLIGRPWSTPETQRAREALPFTLQEGPKGATLVAVGGDTFTLPEISAFVLRKAKAIAESALGQPVDRAVITVPANFNDLQRAATKTAGRLAGLEVLRILNEPTAAALAYGPQGGAQERVAVYDLGGGTFDVTILDLVGNVFEVLATAGDTALGGEDIDLVVAHRMADDLLKRHRFDARKDPAALSRLRILAEEMKLALSGDEEHTVSADDVGLAARRAAPSWRFRMTRPELEWASLALVDRTLAVCQQALDAAGASVREVDRVLLVGGATRMPLVGRKVEQFFGRAPVVRINPDEVVALGAAIQAELLDRSRTRAPGPAMHPRISPESVVQPLPTDPGPGEGADALNLPVIHAKRPASPVSSAAPAPAGRVPAAAPALARGAPLPFAAAPAARAVAPALGRPATGAGVRHPPPVPASPRATLPAPSAAEFLPGRAARTLVFDVPGEPPSVPRVEIDRPTPRADGLKTVGPFDPNLGDEDEGPTAAQKPVPQVDLDGPTRVQRYALAEPAAPRGEERPIELDRATNLPKRAPELELGGPARGRKPPPPPIDRSAPPAMERSAPPAMERAAPLVVERLGPPVDRPPPLIDPLAFAGLDPRGPAAIETADPPRRAPLLIDVTPLSLMVETVGGYCDVLIDANTPVPCDRTRSFATASDGQTTVCVRVAQGEGRRFNDNTFLGEVELSGVTAAPRGEAPIAVTFEIDADGILNVRARDVKTGRETAARIQLAGAEMRPGEEQAMRDRQAKYPLSSGASGASGASST